MRKKPVMGDTNSATGSSRKVHQNGGDPSWTDGKSVVDREKLESAIRGHVFDKLKHSHAASGRAADGPDSRDQTEKLRSLFGGIGPREVLETLLDPKPNAYHRILDDMLERQNRLKHVCTYIISPVAEELGRMWKSDQASFTQITLASGRLSVMVQQVAQNRRPEMPGKRQRSILLGRLQGADHTLGLAVVSACFREAGWDVEGGADLSIDPYLLEQMSKRRYAVLGISIGRSEEIEKADHCIRTVREKFGNQRPLFGLGGAAVHGNIAQLSRLNADFIAGDAWEALSMAEAGVE